MEDMQAELAKLREQSAEFTKIAGKATDEAKRELFARLAEHFLVLAAEVESAISKVGSKE
ncbi:hypothetical protein [Bradyrhizobium sp.]|uniref:hypothetical protein n=1 Tax=Bradyrhizobium sp. TaxID=376 RepID=UPI0026044369|nr:hypothetical protein [Bradyrhizobium sp.]